MHILLTGASGFVGSGVLQECLQDERITKITALNRSPVPIQDPKLTVIQHENFFDLSSIQEQLISIDACFYCLGTTSFQKPESFYNKITYELTLYIAHRLKYLNPDMQFLYISGAGADRSEQGIVMRTRIKGKTENALLQMGFPHAYMLRPGYIQPIGNIRSKTPWINTMYMIFGKLRPFIKRLSYPKFATTTENIGKSMIEVASNKYDKQILECVDINVLATSDE